jgi:hypothetical protein
MANQSICRVVTVPAHESGTRRDELYVVLDGMRIAKRGCPRTPEAGTWVSLKPGYAVTMENNEIVITRDGERVH